MMQQFFDASAKIEKSGKIKDWIDTLKNIYSVLIDALLEINAVDVNLNAEEGLETIRTIYLKYINRNDIQKRIDQLGINI